MYDTSELLRIIKQSAVDAVEASKPVNIVFGTVTNASPLEIQVEQKLVLKKEQLVLSRNVTKHVVSATMKIDTDTQTISFDFSHDHSLNVETTSAEGHTHNVTGNTDNEKLTDSKNHKHTIDGTFNITINNELKKNDRVILLRKQEGQQYIVLDRVGG